MDDDEIDGDCGFSTEALCLFIFSHPPHPLVFSLHHLCSVPNFGPGCFPFRIDLLESYVTPVQFPVPN